jgi:F0F1-type ATP synthase assembly protein I
VLTLPGSYVTQPPPDGVAVSVIATLQGIPVGKLGLPTPPHSRGHPVASFKDNASVATVGIEMVLAVTIGLLVGQAVDELLGTGPWGTVFLVMVGFGAAMKAVLRTIKIVQQQLSEAQTETDGRPLQVTRFERRWS